MTKIQKLVPLAEYKKPLLNLQGDDLWIVERLQKGVKEMTANVESKIDESHLPGLSRRAARALRAEIAADSQNVRKVNELLRMQKANAYAEQLREPMV